MFISCMLITLSFKKSLTVEQFQEHYLNFDFEVVFMSIIRHVSVHKLFFDIVYHTCKQYFKSYLRNGLG